MSEWILCSWQTSGTLVGMSNMTVLLDRSTRSSLYLQIADSLAASIAGGELPLGERLPSERDLARTLGVSRTTVVTAFRELESRGLVRGQVGRGTFVVGGDDATDDGAPFAWRGRLSFGARRFLDPALTTLIAECPPGSVSLGPGRPALDRFPTEEFRRVTDGVLRRGAEVALGLVPTTGHPALRAAIAARHGTDPRQVLVISGAQQGIDVIARCLLDPGDTVVMDRPGYLGAVHTFLAAGATVVGWDIERADLAELENLLLRHAPKLIYTNPTYQNPTGATLPVAKRRELLRLARRHRIPVIEDDPYRELSFAGSVPPPPTLWELDEGGLVIYLGTFSKVLAAGLRLGWILAPAAIVERLAIVKARTDVCGNSLSQLTVRELLTSGLFDRHLATLREEHRRRYRAMTQALDRLLPPGSVTWRPIEGGLYIWGRLNGPGLEAATLWDTAARTGVQIVAGSPFYADGGGERRIRLCFAGATPPDIEVGVDRLATVIQEALAHPMLVQETRPLV